jgi:hypothetical protein
MSKIATVLSINPPEPYPLLEFELETNLLEAVAATKMYATPRVTRGGF